MTWDEALPDKALWRVDPKKSVGDALLTFVDQVVRNDRIRQSVSQSSLYVLGAFERAYRRHGSAGPKPLRYVARRAFEAPRSRLRTGVETAPADDLSWKRSWKRTRKSTSKFRGRFQVRPRRWS